MGSAVASSLRMEGNSEPELSGVLLVSMVPKLSGFDEAFARSGSEPSTAQEPASSV